jgi:hypothetical protein
MTHPAGAGIRPSRLRQIQILAGMKARLLYNSLTADRSRWTLAAGVVFAAVFFQIMGGGALEMVNGLMGVFPPPAIIFLLSLIFLYFLTLVLSTDLFLGHTMNVGQMSTDSVFLSSLPISALSILVLKLLERMVADWLGIFLLGAGFLGISMRTGFSWTALFLSIVLYLQVQLLLGMFTSLLSTFLQRFLRPTSLSNLFSFLAYFTSFLGFLPFYWISQNPNAAFWKILGYRTVVEEYLILPLTPAAWIAETLFHSTPGGGFLKWSLFWAAGMIVGGGLFAAMIHRQWIGSGGARPTHGLQASRAWFSGFFRKELLQLRSDFNLLTNALFLPVTILVMQVWLLSETIAGQGRFGIMTALAIAALYFCMFGPINAVGSEGKAIFLLETLPISPTNILCQKVLFWGLIALSFFLPTAIISSQQLGLPFDEILLVVVWLTGLVSVFVPIGVCLSAIFPDFSARVLQKSSTLSGKLLAAFYMSMALPIRDFSWISLYSAINVGIVLWVLGKKAQIALQYRLDPDAGKSEPMEYWTIWMFLAAMFGIAGHMKLLSSWLEGQTLFPLYLGAFLNLVLMAMMISRTPGLKAIADPSQTTGQTMIRFLGGFLLFGAALALVPILSSEFRHLPTEMCRSGLDIARFRLGVAGSVLWAGVWCLFIPWLEEAFFRGRGTGSCRPHQGEGFFWLNAVLIVAAGVWLFPLQMMPWLVMKHVGATIAFRLAGNRTAAGWFWQAGCHLAILMAV